MVMVMVMGKGVGRKSSGDGGAELRVSEMGMSLFDASGLDLRRKKYNSKNVSAGRWCCRLLIFGCGWIRDLKLLGGQRRMLQGECCTVHTWDFVEKKRKTFC